MQIVYANMPLSEVVENQTSLIPVINRFGIRLGLGDKSVQTICEEHGLDTGFFLAVLNTYLNKEYFLEKKLQTFHINQIIGYLTKTNMYYQHFQIPNIERHLTSFISKSDTENKSLQLIGKFFNSFRQELMARIEKDTRQWFPYCMQLASRFGETAEGGSLVSLPALQSQAEADDTIEPLLADLKCIMVKHLSGEYDTNLCYAVPFSLSSLEKDIKQHNRIRYRILVPFVAAMEKELEKPE